MKNILLIVVLLLSVTYVFGNNKSICSLTKDELYTIYVLRYKLDKDVEGKVVESARSSFCKGLQTAKNRGEAESYAVKSLEMVSDFANPVLNSGLYSSLKQDLYAEIDSKF